MGWGGFGDVIPLINDLIYVLFLQNDFVNLRVFFSLFKGINCSCYMYTVESTRNYLNNMAIKNLQHSSNISITLILCIVRIVCEIDDDPQYLQYAR